MRFRWPIGLLWVGALFGGCRTTVPLAVSSSSRKDLQALRRSVVKIHVTLQRPDYLTPWQGGRVLNASGTGFVIRGRRILTNAHIVSDARFLEVQKDGDARRFKARVAHIGHDCDLALLAVDDPAFFDATPAVTFASSIPGLNDEVVVLGYPMGGDRLCITRGVVSRIDYNVYSHSGVDQHLVLQVDAAINPGNSGGPVLFNGQVVGLAFQGIAQAQNIGYAIPIPVIEHFLADIEDGKYHGYPELGVTFLETRNEALRRFLSLPPGDTGVVVNYVDPFGSARGHLQAGDVLLAIDGHAIASDGTVEMEGNRVLFHEFIERKQWGDSVRFEVWRKGAQTTLCVSLTNPSDPFVYRRLYDESPRYMIRGGLVFIPLNREYLETLGSARGTRNAAELFYYASYAKPDNLYTNVEEFVVLARRLPHTVNTYATGFLNGIVTRVNGLPIRHLRDMVQAFAVPTGGFHVVEFAGQDDVLVLDAQAAEQANPEIRHLYGIERFDNLGEP